MKRSPAVLLAILSSVLFLSPARPVRGQENKSASSTESTSPGAVSPEANDEEKDENAAFRNSPSVRKFGSMLGMKPEAAATAFEVTNFAILAILLGVFLAKALPKAFRDRNSAIQKDLVDARTATEQASVRLSGVEARLAKLDDEIAAMRTQADKDSAADEQRIKGVIEEEQKKDPRRSRAGDRRCHRPRTPRNSAVRRRTRHRAGGPQARYLGGN